MSSRLFTRGSCYGDAEIYQNTVGAWPFSPENGEDERYLDALYNHLNRALEAYDSRLWWQPETSEIFWEDDGSGRDEPDDYGFSSWWEEQISEFNETYIDNGGTK